MKLLILTIIAGSVLFSFIPNNAHAETPSAKLTPFDVSFSGKDFTKEGPSHHQILIMKPNETATVTLTISSHDSSQDQISLSVLTVNLGNLPFSYSFEPQTVIVAPKSQGKVLMHIQSGNTNQTTWGIIPVLAQSSSFGMTGKSFYLIIGKNVTESDMYLVDVSLREGLPGPAFPNLYNDFRTKPPELQKVLDSITANKFGTPRYLPQGYEFQGLSDSGQHPIFIYAPAKVTNTTESIDFVRSGGMIISYEVNSQNFDLSTWMPTIIAQDEGQQVMINGLTGVATEQKERVTTEGYNYKFPSSVTFFQKYSQVYLSANIPLKELLKVAESIPVPKAENPPLILSKVELWGPSSFVANNIKSCIGNAVGQLGPWAVGWIEIQNTKDKTIIAEDITFRAGSIESIVPITLEPKESCVIQTEDQVTTRIGPGGSGGHGPPHGYDGTAVVFEYSVEENGKKVQYVDTTPEISDTFGDTRIWELVDGKWTFKDNPVKDYGSHLSPLKQFKSGIATVDVKCKKDFMLITKASDGSPACVKPSSIKKLVLSNWALKPSDELTLEGLKATYIVGEKIDFTINFRGFAGCGYPDILVKNKNNETVWSSNRLVLLCDPDSGYGFSNWKLGNSSLGTLIINQTGIYSLDVSMGNKKVEKELTILSNQSSIQTNETVYHDFPHPPEHSIIDDTQGIAVSDDIEASKLTGFDIKSPTYLPQDYQVRLVKAAKEIPLVTIFASKYPLTDKTTSEDFLWNQKGILITYDQPNEFELKNYKEFWANSASKVIDINGKPAAVFDISKQYHDGYLYDEWGNIIVIKDNNTKITIRGFFTSDEFIKMATSMLEK